MEIINEIKMELGRSDVPPLVDAVQGDACTRKLRFALTYNGASWEIPSGAAAVVNYQKADGKGGIYDSLPDGSTAYSISGNTATVTLAPQVLTVPGLTKLTVTLVSGEKLLSTFCIDLQVHYNPGAALGASENFVRYSGFLANSGWTANSYLGTDANGNVVIKTLDATLSKSGQAADAAATGKAVSGVQQTANSALMTADDAQAVARTAQETANAAKVTADNAGQVAAEAEQTAAETAEALEDTRGIALYASQRAEDAQLTADGAAAAAQTAQARADEAYQLASELEESVAAESVPSYVEAEADRVAVEVQRHQGVYTLSVMVASDFHHSKYLADYKDQMEESLKHCGQGMGLVAKKAHLDAVARLGDYTWDNGQTPEESLTEMRAVFAATHTGLPEINVPGNHDNNGGGTAALTAAQIFTNIGIRNAGAVYAPDRVLGDCYRDFPAQRLRLIGLNTSNYLLTTAQIVWLTTTLDAMEEGWKAVLLTHCPLNWNDSTTATEALADYAGKVLCIVHGHTHNYLVSDLGDTGIKQIAVPSANFERTNEYAAPWADPDTPGKAAGTARDTAFCVLTFDPVNDLVYADHYGAGYSRMINVSKAEKAAYTNVLPLAVSEWGGSEVYGGDYDSDGVNDGYMVDTRVNSSNQIVSAAGICLSGIIPVSTGDVVRMKNITLTGGATPYLVTYSTAGEMGTAPIANIGGPDENGVYTWANTEGYSAIRLSVGVIDGTSIVTINEEIV